MSEKIKEVLMRRDHMEKSEAENLCNEFQNEADEYLASDDSLGLEDLFEDYFGLEPDYLLDWMLDGGF